MNQNPMGMRMMAEMMGVGFFIFFGSSVVAALIITGSVVDFVGVCLAWGFAIAFAIYFTVPISGGHINPAVSVAMAALGKFPWKDVPAYALAQTAGGFLGAALSYLIYAPTIRLYEETNNIVRGTAASLDVSRMFCTFRNNMVLANEQAFLIEVVLTAALVFGILIMVDTENKCLPLGNLWPVLVGIYIAVIGLAAGSLTGFAMNPARDFGPRLFAAAAGWGSVVLPGVDNYFWIPIVGPLIGGVIGGFVYKYTIGRQLSACALLVEGEISADTNVSA